MKTELFVAQEGGGKAYLPNVLEGVEWSTQRSGTPGRLTFRTAGAEALRLAEGAAVRFSVDGRPVFYGYLFTKKCGRDGVAAMTAYDQLRYFKNKDTYIYENKTAAQLVRMLAADFGLRTGEIDETGYVIASRIEDNTTLFDMVENALGLTVQNTGRVYVLYDDAGRLTLKEQGAMAVGENGAYALISEQSAQDYEYNVSLDADTASRVKLMREDSETGAREVFIARDAAHEAAWGVLQMFDKLSEGENGQAKADAMLKLYNRPARRLSIKKALGDVRVRGGSLIAVKLDLGGGETVSQRMLVEKAVHTFKEEEHTMDLVLRGGGFIG